MDVLNIVACVGVVLLHCNHQMGLYNGEMTFPIIWGIIVNSFVYWPVPVFMMLSGSNLLCCDISKLGGVRKFFLRRIERTVVPFVVWSVIYFLFNVFLFGFDYTPSSFLTDFLTGHFNPNMWFMIPLFSFYISIPFVQPLYRSLSNRQIGLFFLCFFILSSLYPYLATIFDLKTLAEQRLFPMGGSFIAIAMAGYWISHNDISYKWRRKIYMAGISVIIIHFLILYFKTIHDGVWFQKGLDYSFPISVIVPIAVFVFFKYTDWKRIIASLHISSDIVSEVSSCSFGIYLLHNAVQRIGTRFLDLPHLPFVNHYVGFIITYLTCLVIIFALRRIPFIKRLVP